MILCLGDAEWLSPRLGRLMRTDLFVICSCSSLLIFDTIFRGRGSRTFRVSNCFDFFPILENANFSCFLRFCNSDFCRFRHPSGNFSLLLSVLGVFGLCGFPRSRKIWGGPYATGPSGNPRGQLRPIQDNEPKTPTPWRGSTRERGQGSSSSAAIK